MAGTKAEVLIIGCGAVADHLVRPSSPGSSSPPSYWDEAKLLPVGLNHDFHHARGVSADTLDCNPVLRPTFCLDVGLDVRSCLPEAAYKVVSFENIEVDVLLEPMPWHNAFAWLEPGGLVKFTSGYLPEKHREYFRPYLGRPGPLKAGVPLPTIDVAVRDGIQRCCVGAGFHHVVIRAFFVDSNAPHERRPDIHPQSISALYGAAVKPWPSFSRVG